MSRGNLKAAAVEFTYKEKGLCFLPLLEHPQAPNYSHVPPEDKEVQGNTLDYHTVVASSIYLE